MSKWRVIAGVLVLMALHGSSFAGWSLDGDADTMGPQLADLDMGGHSITNVASNSLVFVDGVTVGSAKVTGWDGLQAQITANDADVTRIDAKAGRLDSAITAEAWARMMGDAAASLGAPGYYWDAFSSTSGVDDDASTNHNYNSAGDYWYAVRPVSLESNLLAHWKMNDDAASTDVAESSTNELASTFVGNNTEDRSVAGKIGTALDFDGVANYVSVADDDALTFGDGSSDRPFTIMAWANTDSVGGGMNISKYDASGGGRREYLFGLDANGALYLSLYDESAVGYMRQISGNGISTDGVWIHVVGTYDGSGAVSGIKLYANGAQITETTPTDSNYTAMENTTRELTIGIIRHLSVTSYMDGQLDDIRIYGKALSLAEIQDAYNGGAGTEGLVLGAEGTVGGDMSLVSEVTTWDAALNAITAYVLVTNATADTNYTVDVSLDGKTNWSPITCTTDEGTDGTYYRYSGTATVSQASAQSLYWRIRTTNDVTRRFHALGIVGDAQ